MNLKIGDTIKIKGIGWITVTALHSRYYDDQYQGTDDEGVPQYFNDEDIE